MLKINCDTKKYYESINNSEDKKEFIKRYFSGNKTFENMPSIETTLYDAKTRHQLGAIWLDWTNVGKLLYCDANTIYYLLIKAPCMTDCWTEQTTWGSSKKKTYRFITLSGFTKDHIIETNFFDRYRDYLQELVNKEYGEYIPIKWAKKKKK